MFKPDADGNMLVEVTEMTALLDHVLQKATQNHSMHASWNEGSGDFATCTRGDCTEARELLNRWGWA